MLNRLFASAPLVEQNERPMRTVVRERSESGEVITPESALSVSAVLAAVTIIAEDISSLPLVLYRRVAGGGKSRAFDVPYYSLMHDAPNPEHTSMIFREIMVSHLLAWGNFYGQMIWDSSGTVTEIWPLRPDRMEVARKNGQRVYLYRSADGVQHSFTQDDILHIPAFGFDGLTGYSRIALARNAIGLAKSTEKYGSKLFSNGAKPGVVLKHPKTLGAVAAKNILESWNANYQGADNSHRTALLEEGMDITQIGIPPEDAQFLETRQFQVSEIARIFRVPPHMIGDVSGSTSWGSGIDSQEQGYVAHTLRPWMIRIEQALSQQVLLSDQRAYLFFEHLVDGLLRGDIQTRYASYVQAITNGIMSPNEIRARENLNPYPGGDAYYHPLNIGESAAAAPAAANANPLAQLYQDSAARVIRRECNDIRGAARRTLARGQEAEFRTWLGEFYREHRGFTARQFAPLLAAQRAISGAEPDGQVESYFDGYISRRVEAVLALSAGEIDGALDAWLESADQMAADLMQIFGGQNDNQ